MASVWPCGGVIRVCSCLYLRHVLGLGMVQTIKVLASWTIQERRCKGVL